MLTPDINSVRVISTLKINKGTKSMKHLYEHKHYLAGSEEALCAGKEWPDK